MNFDYTSSEVFGYSFQDQDARQMRDILRHFGESPEESGNRMSLFLRLQALERDLHPDVCSKITEWMKHPFGNLPDRDYRDHVIPQDQQAQQAVQSNHANASQASGNQVNHSLGNRNQTNSTKISHVQENDSSADDSDASVNTSDEETDYDNPFEWQTQRSIDRYLRRHPSMDLFDIIPTHPDNPEREAYLQDGHSTPELSSDDDDENNDDEEDGDEEDEDEDDENDEEEEGDGEDGDDENEGGENEEEGGEEDDDEVEGSEPETDWDFDDGTTEGGEGTAAQIAHVECTICAETFPRFMTLGRITNTCVHKSGCYTCRGCIDKYITTTVENGILNYIKCPICSAVLTFDDVRKISTADVYQRFLYLREVSSRPENFVMCLGPNCGAGQPHEGPEPLMICNHCNFETCVKHKLPWHLGKSCEEFDVDDSQIERLEQEEATARLLAKDSRICPKCKECVVRIDGCDHMDCRCGNAWCYLCGADWENIIRLGETAHGRNCPNHPESYRLSSNQWRAHVNTITELVHGGPVNERLNQARIERDARRRVEQRGLAFAAAEKRMNEQAIAQQGSNSRNSSPPHKKARRGTPRE